MTNRRIVLVGELVVDVTLQTGDSTTKVRMGGVFHAARAAWACEAEYELAYYCPAYLDDEAQRMAASHGAIKATKIGDISGSPSVMLVSEANESGSQGYEHLLRDQIEFTFESSKFTELIYGEVDVIILSGNFSLDPILAILSKTSARVHVDLGNGPSNVNDLTPLGRPVSTLLFSTSASIFPDFASGLPQSVESIVGKIADTVVLKENRGGARLFSISGSFMTGAQRREIVHSVGVGDVFDVVLVTLTPSLGAAAAMSFATWIAAEYASTTFPNDFKRGVERTLKLAPEEILALPAISLPWEARPLYPIYVAAPDFDYVERGAIDELVDCLRYHNFLPRLPVRENGQANDAMSDGEKSTLFRNDIALLQECSLLIAVNIYDDPGTLIEIGLASAKGIPVILYDPDRRAKNVMLLNVPEVVSSSLEKVVTATFDIVARKHSVC